MTHRPADKGSSAITFRTLVLCVALLVTNPAQAVDVNQCSMVADGFAEIVTFDARMADGTTVTLNGILAGPADPGPLPAVVLLSGGGGPVTPYCYRLVVKKLVDWGYVTLLVAGTTAWDRDGNRVLEYSFADMAQYASDAAAAAANLPQVDPARVGLWGHSHGGLSVIEAVSISRGAPATTFRVAIAAAPICPARALPIATPLLVIIGDQDKEVSPDACVDFAASHEDTIGFEFLLLSDADHLFWNPYVPGYSETAAVLAERRLQTFLARHLQAPLD